MLHFKPERRQKGMCLQVDCMHSAVPFGLGVRMCSVARPSPFPFLCKPLTRLEEACMSPRSWPGGMQASASFADYLVKEVDASWVVAVCSHVWQAENFLHVCSLSAVLKEGNRNQGLDRRLMNSRGQKRK